MEKRYYRIKEFIDNHGDTWFRPQVKKFWGWATILPNNKTTYHPHSAHTTKSFAQSAIDSYHEHITSGKSVKFHYVKPKTHEQQS